MKGIKNNMENNEDLKQRLDKLRSQRNDSEDAIRDLEEGMRNLESERVKHIGVVSTIDEEIAKLEADIKEAEIKEAKRLHDELMEAEKLAVEKADAEQQEAERLNAVRLEAERQKAEKLEAERLEAEKLEAERLEKERQEAEKLEAERLEKEKQEAEKKKAEQEKFQNITVSDYSKMLADYKQRIKTHNIGINKLYKLQNQYEHGKIEYSEYRNFAMPLAEKDMAFKKEYDQLNELYNKLSQSKSPFDGLTDEQLNERLNSLNNEYKEKWSINNAEGVKLTDLGKLTSDINAIKDEQAKRKNIANAKALSDSELLANIHTLDKALKKSGNYKQDPKTLDGIKAVFALLNNEYAERKFKHLMNLTDEQIDAKLYELNEEYLNEWNYSAHEANGMEDNDISKLNKIKEQIDFLNYAKTAKENGVVPKLNLEKPQAPKKVMFILERTNPIPSNEQPDSNLTQDTGKPTPEVVTPEPEPVIPEAPAPQDDIPEPIVDNNDNKTVIDNRQTYGDRPRVDEAAAQKMIDDYYKSGNNPIIEAERNRDSSTQKWYQSFFAWIKRPFTKTKTLTSGISTSGLKDTPQNSGNADYDDSDMKTYEPKSNPYFEELKAPDNSSNPSVIKDSSGNVTIDIIPPSNSPKQPENRIEGR